MFASGRTHVEEMSAQSNIWHWNDTS